MALIAQPISDYQNIKMYSYTDSPPINSYIIYDMNGGKYFIPYKDYPTFVNAYLRFFSNVPHSLTLDLNLALCHAICLDIDVTHFSKNNPETYFDAYIKEIFVPNLKIVFDNGGIEHFTAIIAKRVHGGLHVYLPEFYLYNDDYEYLCEMVLKNSLFLTTENIEFKLDCPINFNLPYSSKPNCPPYEPYQILYVETRSDTLISVKMENLDAEFRAARRMFKKKNLNLGSAFRVILNTSVFCVKNVVSKLMMPVLANDSSFTMHKISFNTVITQQVDECSQEIAVLGLTQMNEQVAQVKKYIYKRGHLTRKEGKQVYSYLNLHSLHITYLSSQLRVVRRWLDYITSQNVPVKEDLFVELNKKLKQQNSILKREESPLKAILTYQDGLYFMPVFYALRNYFETSSVRLCEHLRQFLPTTKWLDKISEIDPSVIESASADFTYHTILYCSTNMHETTNSLDRKIEFILSSVESEIDQTIDQNQVCQIIINITKLYFPVRTAMKKRYIWNPVKGQWQECSDGEYRHIMYTLFIHLKSFWEKKFDSTSFPIKNDVLTTINSLICSNDFITQSELITDDRKWILRTQEGVLDLLTGHIGGIVPEHFLSTKVMLPNVSCVSKLIEDEVLLRTFQKLWEEDFLEKYRQSLGQDRDFLNLLYEMSGQQQQRSATLDSLFSFYIDLCKYLRFNYREMKFFLTALATNLVATNYGKFIFILQGEANNGKSRFLNTLQNVFGQYAATISSNTLTHMRAKGNLQPDIALSVFTCRVLTVEELAGPIDENFIKILTGNSNMSARALYENNRSGIPTVKVWASTNKTPPCTATMAFCDRILPFHFAAKFLQTAPEDPKDQVLLGTFKPSHEDSSMKSSTLGMFLHMVFTHFLYYCRSTGHLSYPAIPESITIFREEYLKITDIYSQFKSYADIQEIPGEYITVYDLRSAVRQFLTQTKLSQRYTDEEIIARFDEEFKHKTFYSNDVMSEDDSEEDDDDDADEVVKAGKRPNDDSEKENVKRFRTEKNKIEDDSAVVCYKDIVIKNLKKRI